MAKGAIQIKTSGFGQSILSAPEEGLLKSDSDPFLDGFLEIRGIHPASHDLLT